MYRVYIRPGRNNTPHAPDPTGGGRPRGLSSAPATVTHHTFVGALHASCRATGISSEVRLSQTRGVAARIAIDKICSNPVL